MHRISEWIWIVEMFMLVMRRHSQQRDVLLRGTLIWLIVVCSLVMLFWIEGYIPMTIIVTRIIVSVRIVGGLFVEGLVTARIGNVWHLKRIRDWG